MIQRSAACATLMLIISACSTPPKEGGLDPSPVLTGVRISPDSASLQAGDSVALSVVALMSDGSIATVPVGWAASGGTIGAGTVYHAGRVPGQYLIIGSTAQFQFVDTVRIVIRDTTVAPTLSSNSVSPSAATIHPGTSAVQGFWSDGHAGHVTATGAGPGGTIASSGTFQVVATARPTWSTGHSQTTWPVVVGTTGRMG